MGASLVRLPLGGALGFARGSPLGRPKETTSITIEHGFVKVLVTRGLEVLDFRVALANPRFFREGLVSDETRMAEVLQKALEPMGRDHRRIIGAVPGYQDSLGRLELPKSRGFDPKVVIPREASRSMGISPEMSYITWHRLPDNFDRSRWLVLSSTRRAINSLVNTVKAAGLPMRALELRPFALARAVDQPEAIIAWTSVDGCDVVIVKDSTPVALQSAYWGAEPVEAAVLVNRLTEIVERTVAGYDAQNLDMPLQEWIPLYVCGSSPAGLEGNVAVQVAAGLQRPAGELKPPLALPPDFPVNDLIVNIGLALWGA